MIYLLVNWTEISSLCLTLKMRHYSHYATHVQCAWRTFLTDCGYYNYFVMASALCIISEYQTATFQLRAL